MPRRRTTGCALVGLMVLAACASSPTADPAPPSTIDGAEPSVDAVPPSTTTPCEQQVVLDEYGFPVEFELCEPGDDASTDTSVAAVLARVPGDTAAGALDAGHQAAMRLAAACGNPAAWALEVERSAEGWRTVAELVEGDPALTDWVGSADARALADEFRDLLVFPTDCDDVGSGGNETDETDAAAMVAASGRVAGINDDLRFALVAPEQILFDSDFWYATDQIGHLVDTASADVPIDVLLLGPSTVKRGLDPVQLSEATGREVYNAAVGALAPDLQLSWYRELRASGIAPGTVVLGLNTWIEFLACETPQKDRVEETDDRRGRAFAEIDPLRSTPPGVRLAGGTPPTYAGRALVDHRATWLPGTGGRLDLSDEYQQEIADTQAETYRSLPYDGLCADRLERIAELTNEITDDGSDVVFVVLPTSDAMVAFHPDGRAGHDAVLAEYQAIADETGARLLDTSELVDADAYVDLTHVGNDGRAMVTDALVRFLDRADTET